METAKKEAGLGKEKAAGVTLRIATYNLRTPYSRDPAPNDWESRLPRIKKILADRKIDIFGAQEVLDYGIKELCEAGGYACIGVGRRDEAEGGEEGEHSCIFYRPEVVELLDQGTFWLSETPSVPSSKSWNTAYCRICTWGRFRIKASGKEFVHFNTHLDHVSELAQRNGLNLIFDRMDQVLNAGTPCFLTGDFNMFPEKAPIAFAKSRMNYANDISRTGVKGSPFTFNGYGAARRKDAPIDYIFLSKGIAVEAVEVCDEMVDGNYASDHFPVAADIVF